MPSRRSFLAGVTAASPLGLAACLDSREDTLAGECIARCAEVGPELVVDGEALEASLGDPDLQIVDLRTSSSPGIPGAIRVDTTQLLAVDGAVPGLVAAPAVVEQALRSAGLRLGVPTVAYTDGGQLAAARFLWTLGLHDDFGWRLLDGGLDLWIAEGRPLADLEPVVGPGDWLAGGPVEALRVDADWVLAHLDDPEVAFVDARGPTEFAEGHLPGALSVEWTRNLAEDQRLLPAAEVEALYPSAEQARTIVTYCRTGVRASMAWLALRWLGRVDVRVYDGSWVDWSSDPARPIEA